jgi:hypothetical protein
MELELEVNKAMGEVAIPSTTSTNNNCRSNNKKK